MNLNWLDWSIFFFFVIYWIYTCTYSRLNFHVVFYQFVTVDTIRNIKRFKDTLSLSIEKPLKDYLTGTKFRDIKKKTVPIVYK